MTTSKKTALEALEIANKVRHERAKVLNRFREGEVSFEYVLNHEYTQTATIYRVMIKRKRQGRKRVRNLLTRHRIPEGRLVRDLTERQREELLEAWS